MRVTGVAVSFTSTIAAAMLAGLESPWAFVAVAAYAVGIWLIGVSG